MMIKENVLGCHLG